MTSSLVKNLEELINKNIDTNHLPYVRGKSIRIGKYAIRQAKAGWWVIYDCETNTQDARLFCKTAAIAYAKVRNDKNKVVTLDRVIQKHYTDCMFYKHILVTTKDPVKQDITKTRYDISYTETKLAKQSLDAIIFGT
jgi:hypothetical protein